MKFQVLFLYDEEYEGYVADAPELPGSMSQGKTLEEAIENITDAIRGVLSSMDKHGQPYRPSTRPVLVGEIAV